MPLMSSLNWLKVRDVDANGIDVADCGCDGGSAKRSSPMLSF
jgi:hypothetical protein